MCCYLEFKLHYLKNLIMFSIRVKELFKPIAVMWMQEGRKWHLGEIECLTDIESTARMGILSCRASLNTKYLHFYVRNKMSKNNEIQRKSEHKISFPAKWLKCTYDLLAFTWLLQQKRWWVFALFKSVSWETDVWVMLGDFTVKTTRLGREICVELKID